MSDQLEKLRPALIPLAVLIVAAVLGYMWGASSTRIVDTGPWQLETGYLGMYVQATADAYALDGNSDLALSRLSFLCQEEGDIEAAAAAASELYGADPVKLANLDQLMTLTMTGVAENEEAGVCNNRPVGTLAAIGRTIAPLLLFLLALGLVGYGLWSADMLDQVMDRRRERPREETVERVTPPARAAVPPVTEDTAPSTSAQAAPAEEKPAAEGRAVRRSPSSPASGAGASAKSPPSRRVPPPPVRASRGKLRRPTSRPSGRSRRSYNS